LWQTATLVISILLAAYLTWVSKGSESRVREKIESQNQMLAAHLQLTAELYKRRFDTYDQLHSQLVTLENKLAIGPPNAAHGRGSIGGLESGDRRSDCATRLTSQGQQATHQR
jgi:type II secretory pathway pseudopilin PulG